MSGMLNLFWGRRQEIVFAEGVDNYLSHERAFVGLAPDSVNLPHHHNNYHHRRGNGDDDKSVFRESR